MGKIISKGVTIAGTNLSGVVDNLTSTSTTAALSANQGKVLNDGIEALDTAYSGLLNFFYPVGTIYETTSTDLDTTTKMAAHFGGTWEVYGAGRVLVAKSADTEFDTIGETGGAKTHTLTVEEMPSHDHEFPALRESGTQANYYIFSKSTGPYASLEYVHVSNTGGGQSHNNLQPYIVVYRYRRIA